MKTNSAVLAAFLAASVVATLPAQVKESPIPRLVKKDGRYALMVDGAPYLMLGAQTHNSSAWPAMLPKVWSAMEYLHVNTVEAPVYWEQFEPRQGQYDHTVIDALLAGARQHHVRLVLLWFGTWKNGSQHYMPEWMKLDPQRYFHVMNKEGEFVDSPSPFAAASLEADKRAFAAFMQHLKEADSERTVLMVQVENETGTWGTVRDYSPEANKLFDGPVPAEALKAMDKTPAAPGANWEAVFGPEAEVYFHAWAVSRYVGQVAAAGKAAYPLPLYVKITICFQINQMAGYSMDLELVQDWFHDSPSQSSTSLVLPNLALSPRSPSGKPRSSAAAWSPEAEVSAASIGSCG